MSSDYHDYLDLGLEPEKDSQYWVAPFIKKVFDEIIQHKRPDIAKEIINNTNMQIE
ncbi:MAG TPA: hypothetical protein VKY82_02820 [Flavobacterium sp.]|nr:hypothetical protein [Flavobacterium sp.]